MVILINLAGDLSRVPSLSAARQYNVEAAVTAKEWRDYTRQWG
jgi:acetolactate synthase small subunit